MQIGISFTTFYIFINGITFDFEFYLFRKDIGHTFVNGKNYFTKKVVLSKGNKSARANQKWAMVKKAQYFGELQRRISEWITGTQKKIPPAKICKVTTS